MHTPWNILDARSIPTCRSERRRACAAIVPQFRSRGITRDCRFQKRAIASKTGDSL